MALEGFSFTEAIDAIEKRLPFGRRLVQIALGLAFLAFTAECLQIIGKFVRTFANIAMRRPVQWPLITLGELINITIILGGYLLASYWIRHLARRAFRVFEDVKRRTEASLATAERYLDMYQDAIERLAPRMLTAEQRDILRASLAGYDAGSQVVMFDRYADVPDGEVFGQILRTQFLDTTWHVGGGVGHTDNLNYREGLWISGGRPEDRRAVVAAFAAIGLELRETDDDHPAVIITVGAKTSTEMSTQPA